MAAPGPSLQKSDLDYVCTKSAYLLVVNDAYKLVPNANALYAADPAWWEHHASMVFHGERWTQDQRTAESHGIRWIESVPRPGFSTNPRVIHQGSNSGYQAVNLAILLGANPIYLLGFDMQIVNNKRHFFGDHPGSLNKPSPYGQFVAAFRTTVTDIARAGIKIINCTPGSALDAYPMGNIRTEL